MKSTKFAIGILIILLIIGVSAVSAAVPELVLDLPAWQQANSNGFGDPQVSEVSALETFNGYLFAGTYNPIDPEPLYDGAQIFRSADGITWDAGTTPGFGNTHDTAPPAILDLTVFRGYLYASTGRGNAAQIWRTSDGVHWGRVVNAGFGDPDIVELTVMAEYDGWLYVGATKQDSEAQIWRTYTGDGNLSNWTQVAAGTAPATITGLAVFDGGLYAAIESENPTQIWRSYGGASNSWTTVVNNGFGNSHTTLTGGMAAFGGYLYVGAGNTVNGAQLWRTNNGTNWVQVISPGFGDSNNQKVESVFVFQNQLYVSVKNTATGIELWRSTNGTLWEQANLDGFGDSSNTSSNWSNATEHFLGQLYVGTANVAAGGELWRMQQSGADLALSKVDMLDPVTLGDPVNYTLTVSNLGPEPAQNVVLTDTLPVGLNYVSATPDQGSCAHTGGTLTCNLGNIVNGGHAVVQLILLSQNTGMLTNQASVDSTTSDPDMSNNTSSETTTVNPPDTVYRKLYLPLEVSHSP